MKATGKQKAIIGIITINLEWAAKCNDFYSPSIHCEIGANLDSDDIGLSDSEIDAITDKTVELINLIRKIK